MSDPYPVGSDHAGFALKEAVKGLSGASLRSAAHARFDVLVERGRQPCGGSRALPIFCGRIREGWQRGRN
jgi:hypothetical protein